MAAELRELEGQLEELHDRYVSASPFPHIVLDDFLDPDVAKLAAEEFPAPDSEKWTNFFHVNERKFSNTDPTTWGPNLQVVLRDLYSPEFVRFLSALTGIDDLLVDESLEGGGLHQSVAGGFLNIHADFTVHPHKRHWRRRVNLLLYLTDDWAPEYGGDLELWTKDMKMCAKTVAPVNNRVVVFTTNEDSFHGHPEPLACPPGVARRSLALYYFTYERDPVVRSTEYRARPDEGLRSLVIYLDKQALRAYDWSKRRLGVTDQTAGKILGRLARIWTRPTKRDR